MVIYYFLGGILSVILSIGIGKYFIPMLIKHEIGHFIREDGPESHLSKSGTPTLGGIIFIISTCITSVVIQGIDPKVLVVLVSILGFGGVGLVDDLLIIRYKRNEGLTPSQKFGAQIVVGIVVILMSLSHPETREYIVPFSHMSRINLSIFHIPFLLFVILGTVNSVNLTDGLDGLASTVSIIVLFGYSVISNVLHNEEISIFSIILAGSLIGFLYFNRYPAEIFMGDVGSLGLGGGIVAIAIMTGTVLFLPIIGLIYVVETLSVIIQVVGYKRTGERIFLMSPLHHHYEEMGWHETKVVKIFSLIAGLSTLLGMIGVL